MSILRILGKGFNVLSRFFKVEPKILDAGKKAADKASIFVEDTRKLTYAEYKRIMNLGEIDCPHCSSNYIY